MLASLIPMRHDLLHAAIILSPFFALPLAGWLGGGSTRARLLASLPASLTGYFAYALWTVSVSGPFTVSVPWAPGLNLSLSFNIDGLSALMATLISGVGALVVLYSTAYLEQHPQAGRFQVVLFAFMGAMLGLVLIDNVVTLFVFWELTGFTSYLLIGFEHEKPEARRAATQALIVTGAGGLALLAAAILIVNATGTASLSTLSSGPGLTSYASYPGIAVLVMLAAFTKSAQFPFHFWLPNAMQAPTPVSAYLHSATMVKAGVYLLARTTPLLGGTVFWSGTIVTIGALTMVIGAVRALLETDLKLILAWSTIGVLGVLVLLIGVGTPAAIVAALVYLVAHACYKGALFLVAGSVDHETGTREVTELGGLRAAMPTTGVAGAAAAASMAGIPMLFGFVAKEQFYDSIGLGPLIAAAVAASACLGAAAFTTGLAPFFGRPGSRTTSHDAAWPMRVGPVVLAAAGVVLGLAPAIADRPIALAAGVVARSPSPVDLAIWHGFTPTLALSALTLAASIGLFVCRRPLQQVRRPEALSAEHLYTGTIRALDAVSRRMAPALQSASLRSYVLTVVATATVLVAGALVAGRILPAPSQWTSIHFYEAVLGAFIVASALFAAGARSNMVAVLSVGSVGYGVALMYALLGAPDLAMTQFAVETLTVVIFVLVFHQLRGFADLSPRAVKARDAIVAAATGTLVTTLVLFIGASGTTSRLQAFFADAAPTLAHGRNIVNVILVDFRGFDTLGETTVLVTVAIGVRALLLIGSGRRP
jgi:multicomponent Na+:H+ antiporter subunit A